jgi:hypothetical protein
MAVTSSARCDSSWFKKPMRIQLASTTMVMAGVVQLLFENMKKIKPRNECYRRQLAELTSPRRRP